MGSGMVYRRAALAVEALVGTLAAALAVVVPLIPECMGVSAQRGVAGGLICRNALGRGGWLLFLVAAVSLCVVVLALRGFASTSTRAESLLLAGQIPVVGAAVVVLYFYRVNPVRPPVWGAVVPALCAAIVLLTSPLREDRRSIEQPEGSVQ